MVHKEIEILRLGFLIYWYIMKFLKVREMK